jgi:hypothetical protein
LKEMDFSESGPRKRAGFFAFRKEIYFAGVI